MKISLASAALLTNSSENTLRRRIADGLLTRTIEDGPNGRAMIQFDAIKADCCVPLREEDFECIAKADQGNAEAQNTLALLFLSHAMPKKAVYWLELAIKQKDTDAMHWLGRCYIEGNGVSKDENLGFMWLSRAAAEGHVISREMMQTFREKVLRLSPATP